MKSTDFLGNAFNNNERVICSGYDNGDVKLFDLRKMGLQWETNLANGVSQLENNIYSANIYMTYGQLFLDLLATI